MKIGILALVFGYILSQFYRSFLAVLTPVLGVEVGATASDLSFASGIWFATFAMMQIPVGWALDRFGPRITSAVLLAIGGGGGAIIFATALNPFDITLAMVLFGIGGSPVYMAVCYVFVRRYPQALFATLAGATIGFGSLGNLIGTTPLAYAVDAFGWRISMIGLSAVALITAATIFIVLRDPPVLRRDTAVSGNLLSLLVNRNLLLIFPLMLVNYAPAAGLRGLWAGPYFEDVFGFNQTGIGRVTLLMALAMAAGSFAYGPIERFLGSKKQVVLIGNLCVAILCITLWMFPDKSWITSVVIFASIGLLGTSYPAIIAHGQMFLPAHLTGRGISLLNLLGMGGVGLMQFVTSKMARSIPEDKAMVADFYSDVFLFLGLSMLVGCIIYAFSIELKHKHQK